MKSKAIACSLAALAAFHTVSMAQGPLTPPGAPAPTMKTLDQIEPRTPVQSLAGSALASYVIGAPGSYYLTGNIQGVAGKHGIFIEADDVTIDLNGFAIVGVGAGDFDGISTEQIPFLQRRNITVVNGTIRNWGRDGLNGVFGGTNCVYRDLRLSNNVRNGMTANQATVVNCVALNNAATGIVGYEGTAISNCSAWGNGQGFGCFFGATISNCGSCLNITGILLNEGAIASHCIINRNSGTGLGIGFSAVAMNNQIDNNSGAGIAIVFGGTGGRIEGNTVTRNGNKGINLSGGSGFVALRNTARGNTGGNYDTGAGNSYGPIVNVAGVGDITGTANSNHPAANFSY